MKLPKIRLPSARATEEPIREAALVAGFFILVRGVWLIFPPATWIVCGLALLWVGLPPRRVKP